MNRRPLPLALVLTLAGPLSAAYPAPPEIPAAQDKSGLLFGLDKLWTGHLEISAANWEAMQPTRGPRLFGAPAAPAGKDKAAERPPLDQPRGAFGFDFEYVKGDLELGGQTWKDVGVRFKGNSSYALSARGLKRPFKIDLNRFVEGQDCHGLKMFNLANNAMDPSQLRESLAYAVFRAAGVPAPRTAFVELYLTVPGKQERALLGLYTLIEEVDSVFLKNRFGSSKGLLLKPEGIQGLPYLGPEWKPYEDRYRPKKEANAKSQERLLAFTRLIQFAADAEFRRSVDRLMDVDEFLRYLAACVAMVNLDSFVGFGHNYYLYLNPKDNRFVWIPWDLNHTFGGIALGGSRPAEWAVKKPYLGNNRLTERLLAIPEYAAAYRQHLRDLMAKGFRVEDLHGTLDRMEESVGVVLAREAKRPREDKSGIEAMSTLFGKPPELKPFVRQRAEAVAAQLDGRAEGKDLGAGFGGRGPRLGNQLAKPILAAADADKDGKVSGEETSAALKRLFQECDKEKKGVLGEKALAEGIARLVPRSRGWFGLGPAGPNPLAHGVGVHLAGLAFHKAQSKTDGLALAGVQTLGENWLHAADKSKDGLLDEKELTEGLNALPPAAAVFGSPPR